MSTQMEEIGLENIPVDKKLAGIDKTMVRNVIKALIDDRNNSINNQEILAHVDTENVIKTAENFYSVLAKSKGLNEVPYGEYSFVGAVSKELLLLSDEVDNRIMKSQFSALHALVFGGVLDELYANVLEKTESSGQDEELEIKTEIAIKFLQEIKRKNSEEKMSNFPSGFISVGVEVEYLNYISRMRSTLPIYEKSIKEFELLIRDASTEDERKIYLKYKEKLQREIDVYKEIVSMSSVDKADINFSLWEPGVGAQKLLQIVDDKHTSEVDIVETATLPSASFRTQIRDLIHMSMIGGLRSDWGIHETFGNIKLDKDHTEFMNGLPMAIAAGFFDFDTMPDENAILAIVCNESSISEASSKTRNRDMLGDYFPFHRERLISELEDVGGKEVQDGVELRSTPVFGQRSFIKLVRQINFHYLFAHTVKSVQKEDQKKVEQDHQLAEAYHTLMDDWSTLISKWDKKLYSKWNLKLPDESEKCIQFHNRISVDGRNDIISRNGYLVFITKLIYLSQNAPGFKEDVRLMITKHNSRVKKILDIN